MTAAEGLPIERACPLLGVSVSGCYSWLRRPPSARSIRWAQLTDVISEVHTDSRKTYGSKRVPAGPAKPSPGEPQPKPSTNYYNPPNTTPLRRPIEPAQYTAGAFAKACRRLGIHRSSGRTGNALDNAPAESFFSTLQHELIDQRAWATKAQARQEISLWVQTWYNHHRLHSAIGMVPPVEYEHAHTPDPYNQPLHD